MNAHQLLVRARARLYRPEDWTVDVFARERDDGGISYCLRGAILCPDGWGANGLPSTMQVDMVSGTPEREALTVFAEAVGLRDPMWVAAWNNHRATHEEVIAGLDKAIAMTAPLVEVPQRVGPLGDEGDDDVPVEEARELALV